MWVRCAGLYLNTEHIVSVTLPLEDGGTCVVRLTGGETLAMNETDATPLLEALADLTDRDVSGRGEIYPAE